MKIAVLFDGAGLARLGLEQAGHECIGFELDSLRHFLGTFVGSGNSVIQDAREVDLLPFQGVWSSPPCQERSKAKTHGESNPILAKDLVEWCLELPKRYPHLLCYWIENVAGFDQTKNSWGTLYNAGQFLETPLQNRNRIIGGSYPPPKILHPFKRTFEGACPTITATEHKGSRTDKRRASKFFGRKLTLVEVSKYQGFEVPIPWCRPPSFWKGTRNEWANELYEVIGNGVPPYMAKAFGDSAKACFG